MVPPHKERASPFRSSVIIAQVDELGPDVFSRRLRVLPQTRPSREPDEGVTALDC